MNQFVCDADVLILTILPEENSAVRAELKKYGRPSRVLPIPGLPNHYEWHKFQLPIQVGSIAVATGVVARAGNDTMQAAVSDGLRRFNPAALLIVGVAGGLPNNSDPMYPGDVVIGDSVWSSDRGKIKADGLHSRPKSEIGGRGILSGMQNRDNWPMGWDAGLVNSNCQPFQIITGGIAATNYVITVADHELIREIIKVSGNTVRAVEMESWGAAMSVGDYAATSGRNVVLGMVRGLSDIVGPTVLSPNGDSTKDPSQANSAERDQWKQCAANNAARFVVTWLMNAWPFAPQVLFQNTTRVEGRDETSSGSEKEDEIRPSETGSSDSNASRTMTKNNQRPDLAMVIDVTPSFTTPVGEENRTLSYQITRSESLMRIQPSMRYLEIFRDGGPIEPIEYVWDPFYWQFPKLDFKIVNNGADTVFFTDVCFDILSSRLDSDPILIIRPDTYGMNPRHLTISNQGWGPIRNLRFQFHIIPIETHNEVTSYLEPYPHQVNVDELLNDLNLDISHCLERAGVDIATLDSFKPVNPPWGGFNEIVYLDKQGKAQLISTTEFEKMQITCLGVFKENKAIVSGQLIYDAMGNGGSLERRVKFSTVVHILKRSFAGAPMPPTFEYSTKFEVDGHDYQRRVSISQVLKAGEADRFSLEIGMDKSSFHTFKVKLLYNNGQEIASPLIDLHGFVPRSSAQRICPRGDIHKH